MDLFREIADMINPVKNAQILNEIEHGFNPLRKYTIKLGTREWETTVFRECARFVFAFIKDEETPSEPFKLSSAPYSGSPINTVVNVKQ